MGETYATDASGNKYRTRKDYEAGRFQSMGRNAAQRARTLIPQHYYKIFFLST